MGAGGVAAPRRPGVALRQTRRPAHVRGDARRRRSSATRPSIAGERTGDSRIAESRRPGLVLAIVLHADMSETGIVIVAWNAEAEIGACLDAALRFCADVVVVDNGSQDATVAVVRARPHVRLIANRENRGFAAAVNQGVRSLDCLLYTSP